MEELKDYELNENWASETMEFVVKSKNEDEKLNDYLNNFKNTDSIESATSFVKQLIKTLSVDCELFSYYKDIIKDSYELLNEVIFYCPHTLDEIKQLEENKVTHENLFNDLSSKIDSLKMYLQAFETNVDIFLNAKPDEEIPSNIVNDICSLSDQLIVDRVEMFRFCSNISSYIGETKTSVRNKIEEYESIKKENSFECEDNSFLS